MKAKIISSKVAEALDRLAPVLKARSGCFPGFVLIEATTDKLVEFTAFDDMRLARVKVHAAEVTEMGRVLVEARHVASGVKNQAVGFVRLESTANGYLKIIGDRYNLKTKAGPDKDFAKVAESAEAVSDWRRKGDIFETATFFEMLKKVEYAVSKDLARLALNQVHYFAKGGKVVMEAIDGRRLARVEVEREVAEEFDVLLSPLAIDALRTIKPDGEEDFEAFHDANRKSYFQGCGSHGGNAWELIVSNSALTYPTTSQVIPTTEPVGVVEVDVEEFKRSLKIGSGYLTSLQEEAAGVVVSFNGGIDLEVKIEVEGETLGTSYVRIAKLNFDGEKKFKIRARAKYIAQILAATEDDDIRIEFRGEDKPLVFTYSVPALAVLMPLRVD